MRISLDALGALALVAAVACTDDYGQFDFSGAGASGAAPATGGTAPIGGAGPGGQPGVGGGGGVPTGGAGIGGAGASGGIGGDGGVGATGGAPPVVDVPCGNATCAIDPAVCCIPDFGEPTCEASGDCDGGDTIVHCNGPEDCDAGEFCCGQLDAFFDYVDLTCQSDCGGTGDVVICDPDAPDPCPDSGDECQQSGILPDGYAACI